MMNWQQLISNKRLGQEHRHPERHDDRTEFKRDYDRLIFSAPFRRLQNKTQVFPLPGSIFVHNRLTHSLEVASVGMSLGNDVASQLTKKHPELKEGLFQEIGQIVATAGLAHDLGNPPFGHSGEKAIQSFFTEGAGYDLQRQVPFVLIPAQKGEDGRVIERAVKYIADFTYRSRKDNRLTVEDTKGLKTPEYIIKRKLALYRLGIRIVEI